MMLDRNDASLFGRRIERRVIRSRVLDEPSGVEQADEEVEEIQETLDGAIEGIQVPFTRQLVCGHPHRPGEYLARCEACSEKAKRPVYVCEKCAVTCPVTGQALCLRHTQLGPDGRRYSPEGHKQAGRMGLFAQPSLTQTMPVSGPLCTPSRLGRLVGKLLEWW